MQITSIDNENISEFLKLRDSSLKKTNLIICETKKVILKLKKSKLEIIKSFATNEYEDFLSFIPEDKKYFADKKLLEQIVGFKKHQGIMVLAQRPKPVSLQNLIPPYLILNGLTSPENVGSIVRSMVGLGIKSLIVDEKSCSPFLRRCIRVSMGNIFSLKVHFSTDLTNTIKTLQSTGIQVVGTANIATSSSIYSHIFSKNQAFIIGSEGDGVDPQIILDCDKTVKIPIDQEVAHLNAAKAATIFCYELNKQLSLTS